MMNPICFSLPGSHQLAGQLGQLLDVAVEEVDVHRFPDGESCLRIHRDCQGREALVVADLSRPDSKLAQLLFVSETLRDVGAARVGLVAPYLAYMRQDERFHPGEAITSRYFARLISRYFNWLVTVDPHLHRHGGLDEFYEIPTYTAHAARPVARWLDQQYPDCVLVGPDAESRQWVGEAAELGGWPAVIFDKTRHGDRQVELAEVSLPQRRGRQPVIVDDIISTGMTMVEAITTLGDAGWPAPICIGIHGVFADGAQKRLRQAGADDVVTTNTIAHSTNAIDIGAATAAKIRAAFDG